MRNQPANLMPGEMRDIMPCTGDERRFCTPSDSVDPGVRGPFRVDLPKMAEGGLYGVFWIVYVRQTEARDDTVNAAAKGAPPPRFQVFPA